MYVREMTVRYRLRRVSAASTPTMRVSTPKDAATVLISILQHEVIEVCGLLCLSARNDLLAYHELSRGTLDHTVVHPRDVFRVALMAHAASIVVGHNHPSGDPTPSPDDVNLTHRLKQASAVIGLDFSDHVIVGGCGYYSFREAGQL